MIETKVVKGKRYYRVKSWTCRIHKLNMMVGMVCPKCFYNETAKWSEWRQEIKS